MQFRRLYWIPDGFAATEGAYVTYPFEHYLAILCLESHLAGVPIVGENLGIVPAEVDDALETHGLLGTWVAVGAIDGARHGAHSTSPRRGRWPRSTRTTCRRTVVSSPEPICRCASISDSSTATNSRRSAPSAPTTCRRPPRDLRDAGWLDDGDRRRSGGASYRGLLRSLAASDAPIVLANLEDLWGEPEQQNVPGTTVERPNWRRLTRPRVDELDDDPSVGATLEEARRIGVARPDRDAPH